MWLAGALPLLAVAGLDLIFIPALLAVLFAPICWSTWRPWT